MISTGNKKKLFVYIVALITLALIVVGCTAGSGEQEAAPSEVSSTEAEVPAAADESEEEGDEHQDDEEGEESADDHEHDEEGEESADDHEHDEESTDEHEHDEEGEEHEHDEEGEEHDHDHEHDEEAEMLTLPELDAAELDGEPLRVVATTSIIGDVVSQVGGDAIDLTVLMGPGQDPHSYEPAAQDLTAVADAHIIFINGWNLEEGLVDDLENIGEDALVVPISANIAPLTFGEDEDHSPEAHSREVCEQLHGKTAEEEIQSGAEATAAVEFHDEDEHAHGREIITVKLNAQADGTYAGYLLFHSEEEQGYAFTSAAGTIAISDAAGVLLEAGQVLSIECEGMAVGSLYKLPVGEYVVAITGANAETIAFSAAPMHPHEGEEHHDEHEGEEHHDEHEGEEHHDEHGHHHHSGADPHVWFNIHNVEQWVENVEHALSDLDPANAEVYEANTTAYVAELEALEDYAAEQLSQIPEENRFLVTNHDAFGYFADEYDMTVLGTIIPSMSTLAEPSASDLAELITEMEEHNVCTIFTETTVSDALAQTVAAELSGCDEVQVLKLFTGAVGSEGSGAESFIGMFRANVDAIVSGLS